MPTEGQHERPYGRVRLASVQGGLPVACWVELFASRGGLEAAGSRRDPSPMRPPIAFTLLTISASLAGCSGDDRGWRPDAGAGGMDAGRRDSGTMDIDSGSVDPDSGAGDVDAGGGDVDAGGGDVDSGTGDVDAGPLPTPDAGPLPVDAGRPDAGGGAMDAGCITCPPLPPGCRYTGGTCTACGTLLCVVDSGTTPDSGPAPGGCRSNSDCPRLSYCDFPGTMCSGSGTCRARPEACPAIYAPVCGCDGVTYSNSCTAAAAGANVAYDGMCTMMTDCRTTGCTGRDECMVCRCTMGVCYVCLPRGTAC